MPTFRGADGLWSNFRVEELATPEAFARDPRLVWEWYEWRRHLVAACRPNRAHHVLAAWSRLYPRFTLITQNVDGLHERSGFPPERLVNIHGSDSEVECMACHGRAERAAAQELWEGGTAVPRCACGGPWKPATISFGQALVEADLARSLRTAATADLFVAAGTSLVVGPVNQMFAIAARAGARTAILTASETPYDADADVKLGEPVEQVLPALRDRVVGR